MEAEEEKKKKKSLFIISWIYEDKSSKIEYSIFQHWIMCHSDSGWNFLIYIEISCALVNIFTVQVQWHMWKFKTQELFPI